MPLRQAGQSGIGHDGEPAMPVVRAAVFLPQVRHTSDVPGFRNASHIAVRLHDVISSALDPILEVEPVRAALPAGNHDVGHHLAPAGRKG